MRFMQGNEKRKTIYSNVSVNAKKLLYGLMNAILDAGHGSFKFWRHEDGSRQEEIGEGSDVDGIGLVAVEPDDQGDGELKAVFLCENRMRWS